MTLKLRLDSDGYEALDEGLQGLYQEDGDGFVLDVDGVEDVSGLKSALERQKSKARDAGQKARTLQEQIDELKQKQARESGDLEAFEKSLKDKFKVRETELMEENTNLRQQLQTHFVDTVAAELSKKLTGSPIVLAPHLKNRIQVDTTGDRPVTRIVDTSGNTTALSLEDLEKEFRSNEEFKSVIVGSKASGSGVPRSGEAAPSPVPVPSMSNGQPDLSKMDPVQLAAHIKAKRERGEISARKPVME